MEGENLPRMSILTIEDKFRLKELELNTLLEVTQAINSNVSEEILYKIFQFTVRSNNDIRKMALFVLDEHWECKVAFGTTEDYVGKMLPEGFTGFKQLVEKKGFPASAPDEFDLMIPVRHKEDTIAIIFLGLDHEKPDQEVINFIQTLGNIIIVAIENKRFSRKEEQQREIRKELEFAGEIQKFLFPDNLPYGRRLKVHADYIPHARLGGDYYDYIPINKNQFLICIADVSGKGVPAALLMSNFQAGLRTLIRQTPNLHEIIEALNYQILEITKGEKFITCFAAIYDHNLKTLNYINSGHNLPLLINHNDNSLIHLEEGTTVLGITHPLPFVNDGFIENLDNFTLFTYTDGLTEISNQEDEYFGDERLIEFFKKHGTKDLKEIHELVILETDRFRGQNKYLDDITIMSCKVEP